MAVGSVLNQGASQSRLTELNRETSSALRRLSAGQRVTRAADDGAALSISAALQSDRDTTRQAINNIQSGMSVLRTAEGGLDQIGNLISRAKELAVQGAGPVLDPSAREGIQAEINSIKSEISRIATVTEFNGQNLLDGSLAPSSQNGITVQVGINNSSSDRISLNAINGATTEQLGLSSLDVSSAESAARSIDLLDRVANSLGTERAGIGALQNRFEAAASNLGISSENLLASIETVSGLDVPAEASRLERNKTIQSVSVAVQKKGDYLNKHLVGELLDTKI
ncbi:MAG: flagellin [Nitrospinota bacterium]